MLPDMAKELGFTVHPKHYGGKDPKKLAKYHAQLQDAATLQKYLQDKLEAQPHSLMYGDISRDTGVSLAVVKELLFRARGGSNGITI